MPMRASPRLPSFVDAAWAAAALLALAACAGPASDGPIAIAELRVLTDSRGMTLYTVSDDAPGQSNCYGRCAQSWPPLLASATDRPGPGYSLVARTDGTRQWAYKGQPLYTWNKEKGPGEIGGHNVGENWFVARP